MRTPVPRRSGSSLAEMMAVATLSLALISGVAAVLRTLYLSHHRARTSDERDLALQRLAADFRRDAHEAIAAQSTPQPPGLVFRTGDGPIQYRVDGRDVLRVDQRRGEVRREFYRFVTGDQLKWAASTSPPVAAFELRSAERSLTPAPAITIRATIGLVTARDFDEEAAR